MRQSSCRFVVNFFQMAVLFWAWFFGNSSSIYGAEPNGLPEPNAAGEILIPNAKKYESKDWATYAYGATRQNSFYTGDWIIYTDPIWGSYVFPERGGVRTKESNQPPQDHPEGGHMTFYFRNTKSNPSEGDPWNGTMKWSYPNLVPGNRFAWGGKLFRLLKFDDRGAWIALDHDPLLVNRVGTARSLVSGWYLTVGMDMIGPKLMVQQEGPWTFGIPKRKFQLQGAPPDQQRTELPLNIGETFEIPAEKYEGPELHLPKEKVVIIPRRVFRLTDFVPRDHKKKIAGWYVLDVIDPNAPVEKVPAVP